MKCKIFSCANVKYLEDSINKFIEDKCICKVLQSESCGMINVTIIYDDECKCDYVKTSIQKSTKAKQEV